MPPTPYASRINQLDAAQLDTDIFIIFREQAKKLTRRLPPGDKWQPEVDVIIKCLIWYYSLRTGRSTFGQRLLNLKYANLNQKKAIWYLVLTTLPKYAEERLADSQFSINRQSESNFKIAIEYASNLVHVLSFVNLLVFLLQGKQPLIVERILGIRSQMANKNKPRHIGYSFMARELLWDGLLELLSIGVPMINFHYLKQSWNRFWYKKSTSLRIDRPTMDVNTVCAYCGERPILPRHAGCEHLFCYYCIKGHFTATDVFLCPVCGTDLHANKMKMYDPKNV